MPLDVQQLLAGLGLSADAACPALLLPDHTLFSPKEAGNVCGIGPAVCVEIKPKSGLLVSSPCVPPGHDIKRKVPRYLLHQFLKFKQCQLAAMGRYSPLDLFSNDLGRMRRALAALFETPSNNLRVFVDGRLAYGAAARPALDAMSPLAASALPRHCAGGAAAAAAADGQYSPRRSESDGEGSGAGCEPFGARPLPLAVPQLVSLLAAALQREGVLPRLLQLQRLDEHDISGVAHLYRRLAAEVAAEGAAATEAAVHATAAAAGCSSNAVARLLALPLDSALAVLRGYLTAATARDCAVMVTLQEVAVAADSSGASGTAGAPPAADVPAGPADCSAAGGADADPAAIVRLIRCPASGRSFRYKLAFVDLDMKAASKIPAHHALDQRILECVLAEQEALMSHLRSAGLLDCDGAVLPFD